MSEEDTTPTSSSPYVIVRTIKEVITSAKSEKQDHENKVTALIQKRRRDDGKMSGEFVTIKVEVGRKVFFFNPSVAREVVNGVTEVLPEASTEDARLREEFEARRQRDRENWEKQINGGGGEGKEGHRHTGKTDRDRKKTGFKPYEKRKQEKSERDREIRSNMQKNTR